MDDEYQTRQFFNMKHSELKQIIKEEIRNVLNESDYDQAMQNLARKADITLSEPDNRNKFRPISLPAVSGDIYRSEIDTLKKFNDWKESFREKYIEEPEFDKSDPEKWKVTNPKFVKQQQMYDKVVRGFGTKGD
jgi:uncharacterized protein YdiU (UPF0061 family)